ncbi:hypothetical protein [Faecalimicrobium sp. JNUCC 81]
MKSKKVISISLILSFILSIMAPISSFANNSSPSNSILQNSNEQNDVYKQNLIENVNFEGVNYTYKYYYDDNSNRCILVTNNSNLETNVITYNEADSTIYLDSNKIATVKSTKDDTMNIESKSKRSKRSTNTNWKLINIVHHYVSWKKGVTTAVVAGAIATVLGFATNFVVTVIGFSTLSILASSAIGGTVHFSKYYRFLPFDQTQYKTDWAFVASTGERFGTYTYMSSPR